MNRGELYRALTPARDPRSRRVYVVVSRAAFLKVRHSTVVCAPVYSKFMGLSTEVRVGEADGLKHPSGVHCDELVSVHRALLTDYVGSLSAEKMREMNRAMATALDIDPADLADQYR